MTLKWFKKKEKKTSSLKENSVEKSNNKNNANDPATSDIQQEDSSPLDIDESSIKIGLDESQVVDTPKSHSKKSGRLLKHLKTGLTKTRNILTTDIDKLFSNKRQIDDDMLEALEELLITSDIGVQTTMELIKNINQKAGKIKSSHALKDILKKEILSLLKDITAVPSPKMSKPHVVMVVGVNGVGKTTTIGKLAAKAVEKGDRVLIAAADTFRAAAIEQLTIWAEKSGAEIVKHKANADPAAVAYDSMEAASARNIDTVFVDTAGRLHTKVNLMEELKKIKRTITKKIPGAPHEVLLVLDATTGQNALSQARLFHADIGVSGIALTKLDGTAKGGIVISISQALSIPLQYIGVGEDIDDLQTFDPESFADALF